MQVLRGVVIIGIRYNDYNDTRKLDKQKTKIVLYVLRED
ncbi:diguanylate cyclase [Thermoanaerobacterium thermosaccharolyticum]|uniref:Diguanylate cyclase n=1 Tax=Thermoanaerobacterium thermosaccharolyticum TaxID=1517 RepID=A0A223HYP6_THETR|nr:diguanylate cyclase [Thermoanaerobacterium thermosaccharolyticum]MCP2241224.1 hypothetical protein [Thermoanaerobacterium thermosaccharolyticum]TCW30860.1 hypothetical protein EDC21_1423 [Thermohydrogenium kirishiense]